MLDFDGFLLNSYELIRITFESFGLDVGNESRFKNRRKFLKYIGGGKELLGNLVSLSLPRKKEIRHALTDTYLESGVIYNEFCTVLETMIEEPNINVGIISRNFTHNPGSTIRAVLDNSGIDEKGLDFVIPIPVGIKKTDVLEGMKSPHYVKCIFGGDEIGDYRAAIETGYDPIMIASYGFDDKSRLIKRGRIPKELIFDSPSILASALSNEIY